MKNKPPVIFFRAVGLIWASVFRLQSKDETFHYLLFSIRCWLALFWASVKGEQVLPASTQLGPQVQVPRSYPQCVRALGNASKAGTRARSHMVFNCHFSQARLAPWPRDCCTFHKAKGALAQRGSFLREGIHHGSWRALSCNTGEVCFSFCLWHFWWGDGINWLFFIWILYAGFVWQWGPYCPFRNWVYFFSTALICL